jgi:hypothetical protein
LGLVRAQDADELARLTNYVTDLRKRHDEMRQLAARKEVALQTRVDSVKVCVRAGRAGRRGARARARTPGPAPPSSTRSARPAC